MADKQTLEAALLARRNDPRALRGAITIVKGAPRLVFGVVGEHKRFSVDISGDEVKLVDDPRREVEAEAPESAPEAEPAGEDTPEGSGGQDTGGNQGEAANKAPNPEQQKSGGKRGKKK